MVRKRDGTNMGNGFSQLVGVIRDVGHNEYDKLELATVIASSPDIRIRIDNMAIDLDADDLVIPEHILDIKLNPGSRVLIMSMNNGQKYAILGKIP